MKKIWFLVAGFVVGVPLGSSADPVKMDKPPKVEESSREADKAAVHAAASEADQWAAKNASKETPKAPEEAAKEPVSAEPPKAAPAPAKAAAPVEIATPAAQPKAVRTGLNEMKGKFQSKSYDPKSIRLIVDGGYNVEFSYDSQTKLVNGGSPIGLDDLEYNDEVIIRYSGKELYALEIDRVSKAQRPQ